MRIPKGIWKKYTGVDICFINSGSLKWLLNQDFFIMPKENEDIVVAVEEELRERDTYDDHFSEDKVRTI